MTDVDADSENRAYYCLYGARRVKEYAVGNTMEIDKGVSYFKQNEHDHEKVDVFLNNSNAISRYKNGKIVTETESFTYVVDVADNIDKKCYATNKYEYTMTIKYLHNHPAPILLQLVKQKETSDNEEMKLILDNKTTLLSGVQIGHKSGPFFIDEAVNLEPKKMSGIVDVLKSRECNHIVIVIETGLFSTEILFEIYTNVTQKIQELMKEHDVKLSFVVYHGGSFIGLHETCAYLDISIGEQLVIHDPRDDDEKVREIQRYLYSNIPD